MQHIKACINYFKFMSTWTMKKCESTVKF